VFIHNAVSKWQLRVDKGERFARNLCDPDSEFPWEIYMSSTIWRARVREVGVASFWLVWVGDIDDGCCGSYVEYGEGIERVIIPEYQYGDEEPVVDCMDSIMWHV